MPFSFRVDAEHSLVRFKASDSFTSEDMLSCVEKVVADPAFEPEFDHLVDLRQITQFEASPRSLRSRADRDRVSARLNTSRIAVVSSSEVAYGMSRMYEELMDGAPVTVRTFKDIAEAQAWLGLPPDCGDD